MVYKIGFSAWIKSEREKYGISQNELSRRSGISRSYITMVENETRSPGMEFCNAIASVFKIPPEEVMRKAGLLETKSTDRLTEEAEYLFGQLNESQRQQALKFLRFLADERGNYAAANTPLEATD